MNSFKSTALNYHRSIESIYKFEQKIALIDKNNIYRYINILKINLGKTSHDIITICNDNNFNKFIFFNSKLTICFVKSAKDRLSVLENQINNNIDIDNTYTGFIADAKCFIAYIKSLNSIYEDLLDTAINEQCKKYCLEYDPNQLFIIIRADERIKNQL